jgi:hypothetical protein
MQPQSYEVPKFRIRSKWLNEHFDMQNKYFLLLLVCHSWPVWCKAFSFRVSESYL